MGYEKTGALPEGEGPFPEKSVFISVHLWFPFSLIEFNGRIQVLLVFVSRLPTTAQTPQTSGQFEWKCCQKQKLEKHPIQSRNWEGRSRNQVKNLGFD